MSDASGGRIQNGQGSTSLPMSISTPSHHHQITFNPPSQAFTASAPPTAAASHVPTPVPAVINAPSIQPIAPTQGLTAPPTAPDQGRSLRKRAPTMATDTGSVDEVGERTTRSGTAFAGRARWMPKLKLKVNESADGRRQSFLGPYDRDLDSEDEELVFEEHFLLRMPEGKEADRMRDLVAKRAAMPDVWFKFKGLPICYGVDAM